MRPDYIDTVEKLIDLYGRVKLECTSVFNEQKDYYLSRYPWYGPYNSIFYNKVSDMFCVYNSEHECYDDVDLDLAYELAQKELGG